MDISFPPPWCNETAYPVEAVTWEGVRYSRLDAATALFHQISPWLLRSIRSVGRLKTAAHIG